MSYHADCATGLNAKDALERSKEMMTGFRRGYAWPYLSLLVGIRLLDMIRTFLLAVMPPRYWQELVEMPIVLIVAFAFAKIVVIRCGCAHVFGAGHVLQDIMPAAAYISRKSPRAESEDSAVVEEQSVAPRLLPSIQPVQVVGMHIVNNYINTAGCNLGHVTSPDVKIQGVHIATLNKTGTKLAHHTTKCPTTFASHAHHWPRAEPGCKHGSECSRFLPPGGTRKPICSMR
eukprot:359094-Chlamydomonas_euryale.AAC.22